MSCMAWGICNGTVGHMRGGGTVVGGSRRNIGGTIWGAAWGTASSRKDDGFLGWTETHQVGEIFFRLLPQKILISGSSTHRFALCNPGCFGVCATGAEVGLLRQLQERLWRSANRWNGMSWTVCATIVGRAKLECGMRFLHVVVEEFKMAANVVKSKQGSWRWRCGHCELFQSPLTEDTL